MKKISYLMLMCCFGTSAVQAVDDVTVGSDYYQETMNGLVRDLNSISTGSATVVNKRPNIDFTVEGIEAEVLQDANAVKAEVSYDPADPYEVLYDKFDCGALAGLHSIEAEKGSFSRTCNDIGSGDRSLTAGAISYNSGYGYEIAKEHMPDPADDFPATFTSYNFESGSVNFRDAATGEYKVVDSADYEAGTHSCISTHTVKLYVDASNTWRDGSPETHDGETEYTLKSNLFTTWKGNGSGSSDKVRIYKYYFCGAENVDSYLYKQHTSVDVCTLTPNYKDTAGNSLSNGLDGVLSDVDYTCTLNSTKRVYWGHEFLVPIQVGDIAVFVPVPEMDTESLKTTAVHSDITRQDNIPGFNQPITRVELTCVTDTNGSLYSDVKHDFKGTNRLGFEPSEGVLPGSVNGIKQQCSQGIHLNSTFIGADGILLPYIVVENSFSEVTFAETSGISMWTNAALYLQENIDRMVVELNILDDVTTEGSTDEAVRTDLLCAASEALNNGLGLKMDNNYGALKEDHFQVDTKKCSVSQSIWWKYADNIDGYYNDLDGDEANDNSFDYNYLRAIRADVDDKTLVALAHSMLVNANKLGSNFGSIYSDMKTDLRIELGEYLNTEVDTFLGLANQRGAVLEKSSCDAIKTAVTLMLTKLNGYNEDPDTVDTDIVPLPGEENTDLSNFWEVNYNCETI